MLVGSRYAIGTIRRRHLVSLGTGGALSTVGGEDRWARQIQVYSSRSSGNRPLVSAVAGKAEDKVVETRSAKYVDLLEVLEEPPLMAQGASRPLSKEELEKAVARIQRKLRRFALHRRTVGKLEAIWNMYRELVARGQWRLGPTELGQFLDAILRVGAGVEWSRRAEALVEEHLQAVDHGAAMCSLRVYAKFGDLRRFDMARCRFDDMFGREWSQRQPDFVPVRAILYAKLDLPAQAEKILDSSAEEIEPRPAQADLHRPPPARAMALKEIMLAWTRAGNEHKAWETISRLLVLGYGRTALEWNALLHMHAVDLRYRFNLLEEVLARMRRAGVAYDAATYNIMMHASLLRSNQAQWRSWYGEMERAGFLPSAHTYVSVATQLARCGRWSEARDTLEQMRNKKIRMTGAARTALDSLESSSNRIPQLMARFRADVLAGRRISAQQFAAVAVAALGCPGVWAAEIALLIGCLEDSRVEEGAVVDAMAARLPGLDKRKVAGRPLLQSDPETAARQFMLDIGDDLPGKRSQLMIAGSQRVSFTTTLNVIIKSLLRDGLEAQAKALVAAAEDASIAVNSEHTLLALLRYCRRHPQGLGDKVASTTFTQPTSVSISLLVRCVRMGDLEAAREHFTRLERLIEDYPKLKGFYALLFYAHAVGDAELLELKWRQMEARGVLPDARCHQLRISCYAAKDNLLRTRRAYTDMLDHGYPPTYQAVNALVRCSVRKGAVDLALTAMRHAEVEHGVSLNVTTYNYVLSRLMSLPNGGPRAWRMFSKMVDTRDHRLSQPLSTMDTVESVGRQRARFVDLRVLSDLNMHVGGTLLSSADDRASVSRMRKALVNWLTSRAAFSAEPTMFDPKHRNKGSLETKTTSSRDKGDGALGRATAPAPNATTFIIMIRGSGRVAQWQHVLAAWDALVAFNARVDRLVETHPFAATMRVVPFSRMIGWVALSLCGLGREEEARGLWDRAAQDGLLSDDACARGMQSMLDGLRAKVSLPETEDTRDQ
ncbi:hypothetical protein LPJ56_000171 [Coemansia sp. RSA 2599]|nr:hypothetical protein LPJ75_000021 [Coemansia sp. RSA 2598]KAJ1829652.1 hypothetical protein LPJ56_000171 [Coemansia sp. RSA 2599]